MMDDLFGDLDASAAALPTPPAEPSKTIAASADNTSAGIVFEAEPSPPASAPAASASHEALALPCMERIHTVLAAHGVEGEALPEGLLEAVVQLVSEAQAAPADLPRADRLLCWVMDSELAQFAPTRVRRALAPLGTNNGERMIPLYVPDLPKGA